MHQHNEIRVMPYTCEQMFDLVADIEKYPEFLPWCTGAKLLERDGDTIIAELTIGFGPLHERFTSRVTLERPRRIDVVGVKGPFKHLENRWQFQPTKKRGECSVDFEIDFAFRNFFLQAMMATMFRRSVSHMVEAFEDHAARTYAQPPSDKPPRKAVRGPQAASNQNAR